MYVLSRWEIKKKKSIKRKRSFRGNKYVNKTVLPELAQQPTTNMDACNENTPSSSNDVDITVDSNGNNTHELDDSNNFFSLINFKVLQSFIMSLLACGECGDRKLVIEHLVEDRQGFCLKFTINCNGCHWKHCFYSSPEFSFPRKDQRGKRPFEINVRAVMAFREIGKGHEAMKTFNSVMNMCPPISTRTYNKKIHDIYQDAANDCMKAAANDVRHTIDANAGDNDIIDTDISIDGSWQKRGHSSLNRVVTGVSPVNKKVIDCLVYTKFCPTCARQNRTDIKKPHACKINQSSGRMESAGAVSFFHDSISKHHIRYAHYIGDGDTESFKKMSIQSHIQI